MEEFVTEEEEPWYDQRDLEQGEGSVRCVVGSVSGEGWLVGWGVTEGVTIPLPQ